MFGLRSRRGRLGGVLVQVGIIQVLQLSRVAVSVRDHARHAHLTRYENFAHQNRSPLDMDLVVMGVPFSETFVR